MKTIKIFKVFLVIPNVIRALYFLIIYGYRFYTVIPISDLMKEPGYNEIIGKAIIDISQIIDHNKNLKLEILDFFEAEEPYHFMLIDCGRVQFEIVLLSYLMKEVNLIHVFDKEIEILPKEADDKYGLVKLDRGDIFNHQGVKFGDKFFYFNPFIRPDIRGTEPPKLIQILSKYNNNGNSISLRLDYNISISFSNYKPNYIEFFQVYYGKEINLDNLEFPFNKEDKFFCVFNPISLKKIQFRLSVKEQKKWIEIEELWQYDDSQEIYITRYLHSIYDEEHNRFEHIDGSINRYTNEDYRQRHVAQISAHATSHIKIWLINGIVSIKDWAKLVIYYFNDYDLLLDAFSGQLIEEIFEEELYKKQL